MTPPGANALMVTLAVALVIFVAYASGRIHEWYRYSFEREQAYREGYDRASHSLFQLATRSAPQELHLTVPRTAAYGRSGPRRSVGFAAANRHREMDLTRIDQAGAA